MPPLPNVPKVVRLDHLFNSPPNGNIFTRNYVQYSGALSVADANTWSASLAAAFGARWKAHMSSAVTYLGLTMTDLNSNTGPQVGAPRSDAGSVVNAIVSNATCVVVEWETARRFRGGHPRSYMPGGPASLTLDTETWTAAAVANWHTDFLGWVTDMSTAPPAAVGTALPVAVSYFQGFTVVTRTPLRSRNVNSLRVGGPLVDVIVNAEPRLRFGTQRRRIQGSA